MDGLMPLLLEAAEVSELLRLNTDAVYRLIREGELQTVKIASRDGVEPRKIRIPFSSVEAYVQRLVADQCGGDSAAADRDTEPVSATSRTTKGISEKETR